MGGEALNSTETRRKGKDCQDKVRFRGISIVCYCAHINFRATMIGVGLSKHEADVSHHSICQISMNCSVDANACHLPDAE